MRRLSESELQAIALAVRWLTIHSIGYCVLPVVYETIRSGRLFVFDPDELVYGTAVDISAATPGGEIVVADWVLQREDPFLLAEILAHEALHIVRADAATMERLPSESHAYVFNVAADAHIQEWIRAGDSWDVALFGRINAAASDHFGEEIRIPDCQMIAGILQSSREHIAKMTTGEIYERLLEAMRFSQHQEDLGGESSSAPATIEICERPPEKARRLWHREGHVKKSCYAPTIDTNNALTEVEREMLAQEVAKRVLSRGDMPLGLRRWAEKVLSGRERDVVRALRSLVSQAARQVPDRERTFQYPSRRQPRELAEQGIVLPGYRRKRAPRIVIVVDTSQSMSESDLANALGMIFEITRAFGEVVVMPTDANVHAVQRVASEKNVELLGGGGTDMGAALRRIESNKIPCDIVVVFSDCDTPWPPKRPRFPVVVVHKGNRGSPPPWRHLYINIP
jgi:predicted metal-dependent peptidase